MSAKKYIVLDTETTGLDFNDGHKIIEIGAVVVQNRKKTDDIFHTYINPERAIDKEAQQVHVVGCRASVLPPLDRFHGYVRHVHQERQNASCQAISTKLRDDTLSRCESLVICLT